MFLDKEKHVEYIIFIRSVEELQNFWDFKRNQKRKSQSVFLHKIKLLKKKNWSRKQETGMLTES